MTVEEAIKLLTMYPGILSARSPFYPTVPDAEIEIVPAMGLADAYLKTKPDIFLLNNLEHLPEPPTKWFESKLPV